MIIYIIFFLTVFALFLYQKSDYASTQIIKGCLLGFSYAELPLDPENPEDKLGVYQVSLFFILITLYYNYDQ